ncbi:unnamed protein product [Adineta steineri]|uniref:Uncharacterized protein n=1 Tax=Adineta steineri TaxID=433720 RepID=A0A815FDR8_9BILA|nr:unnamed protein product [Adineta steineri]
MNRYFPYPFMIFGTIGLLLNVAIFTRQSLCNNSCVQYLLFNTLSNFIVLYWVVTTRIVSDGYGDDLEHYQHGSITLNDQLLLYDYALIF